MAFALLHILLLLLPSKFDWHFVVALDLLHEKQLNTIQFAIYFCNCVSK